MSNQSLTSSKLETGIIWGLSRQNPRTRITNLYFDCYETLPAAITKAASKQAYYTIRFLVDRERTLDAYRAYGYFRWVDDWLDERVAEKSERIAFVERQQRLIESAYCGQHLPELAVEEQMLIDLIRSDREPNSGLQTYIRNLMAVMAFDADRRGRLISQQELDNYTRNLAVAVTEALHYFIGHDASPVSSEARYFSATAAHIIHMLRDTFEDNAAGYFNIPYEFLQSHKINACDVQSDAYREWVESRVKVARNYLQSGKHYLRQVRNRRCRMAGYAYTARFQGILDAIEREDFRLRANYPEQKTLTAGLRMAWSVLTDSLEFPAVRRSAVS